MSRPRMFAARLLGMVRHSRLERQLDQEVRFHLEMQLEDNLRAGMSPAEARYEALRSFGGIEPMKEAYRDRRSFAFVQVLAQDFRYALRTLRKSPGFTATSILVLALAMGANTAMFSVLKAVLFTPLPYQSPDRLAMLWTEVSSRNIHEGRTAFGTVEQWRTMSRSFSGIAVMDPVSLTLNATGNAERISAAAASPDLFSLLGVQPVRGRMFSTEEAERRQRLAVISHGLWQSRFGGSPDAIGASIELDGASFQVIGILPSGLPQFNADVWEPHTLVPDWESQRGARGSGSWFVVGRLRADVTFEQARAELNAIASRLDEQLPPAERGRGARLTALAQHITGPQARVMLWMLSGAVFCVLLVAATNIASLTLARNATREREIAVRAALGASRARIVWQLLVESLTLAALAGLVALSVAYGTIRLIAAAQPGNLIPLNGIGLDPQVLLAVMTLCLLTGVLIGLGPGITIGRRDLHTSVQCGGRGIAGTAAALGLRRALVVTEFSLAVGLSIGAGLLVRSLWSAQNVRLGFRPGGILTAQLLTSSHISPPQRAAFYSNVLAEVSALPGVEAAGLIENLFVGDSPEQAVTVEGDGLAVAEHLRFRNDAISDGFFKTVGTPLLRGRYFSKEDGPEAPRVAIVNDAMARRLWQGRDPVGRRFQPGGADKGWITVAGVVGDMRRQGLENEPAPQMFVPLAQDPPRPSTLLVRTSSSDPLQIAGAVQAAVRRVDKHVPVYGTASLEGRLGEYLTQRRFQTALLTGFSVIALLMAAIGIHGLIQYSVTTRSHEIGIRLAVGAQAGDVFGMVLGEGLKLSLAGLAIGMTGALWLGQAGSSLLFGVNPTDPWTFGAVSLLLTAAAAAGCYFPARRAMKIDPMTALRLE